MSWVTIQTLVHTYNSLLSAPTINEVTCSILFVKLSSSPFSTCTHLQKIFWDCTAQNVERSPISCGRNAHACSILKTNIGIITFLSKNFFSNPSFYLSFPFDILLSVFCFLAVNFFLNFFFWLLFRYFTSTW